MSVLPSCPNIECGKYDYADYYYCAYIGCRVYFEHYGLVLAFSAFSIALLTISSLALLLALLPTT